MKTFILAATVAAGLLCSASTADAQYRRSRANVYSYPSYSYSYPSYSYGGYSSSSYYAPSYYTPSVYGSNDVIVTSGYTPTYSSGVITSGSYYTPSVYGSSYYTPSTYGSSYYNTPYYGGYNNGLNITPSGAYFGGSRILRW